MNQGHEKKGFSLIPLLFKNPILALVILIIIMIMGILSLSFMYEQGMGNSGISDESKQTVYVKCTDGKLDNLKFDGMFRNAGVFTDKSNDFIQISSKNQIDPVLLASIAFNETGKGNSSAVKTKNNPGGLMNPQTGKLMVFSNLDEGLDAMASNLSRLYISKGLLTIVQIGNKYAPVGATNDPNNLNLNWVPNVTQFANDFGGLTMNCTLANEGSGEFYKPLPNAKITSKFGQRIDPISGSTDFHLGIDFSGKVGDTIYCASSGKVVVATMGNSHSTYGHHVVVESGGKFTLYAHMTNVYVKVGQTVEQAQQIGTVGATGRVTGPHLHFEVQLSLYGQRIDPMPFFGG